jgi:hypothetical protein
VGDSVTSLSIPNSYIFVGLLSSRPRLLRFTYVSLSPAFSPPRNEKAKSTQRHFRLFHWWTVGDSNPRPLLCHSSALATCANGPRDAYYISILLKKHMIVARVYIPCKSTYRVLLWYNSRSVFFTYLYF